VEIFLSLSSLLFRCQLTFSQNVTCIWHYPEGYYTLVQPSLVLSSSFICDPALFWNHNRNFILCKALHWESESCCYSDAFADSNTWRRTEKGLLIANEVKQTPWPESASELCWPRDRRLSTKLVPTFADRGCHVLSATDPNVRIHGFIDRMITR
jgi:hypothetical protein